MTQCTRCTAASLTKQFWNFPGTHGTAGAIDRDRPGLFAVALSTGGWHCHIVDGDK